MTLILIILGVFFGPMLVYFAFRLFLGIHISLYAKRFAYAYDAAIAKSFSKTEALRSAIAAFRPCYPFRKLTTKEWDDVGEAFASKEDPREIFLYTLAYYPAKQVMRCFRNPDFLRDLKG